MLDEQVRAAELDIDKKIERYGIWKCSKNHLLRGLLDVWRDGLDLAYARATHGSLFDNRESTEAASAIEHQINTGTMWCLKWAFEYGAEKGSKPTAEQLVDLVWKVGAHYQLLVDALKFAQVGGNDIRVNLEERTLIIYEGANISGYDQEIVSLDRTSLPSYKYSHLIDDGDQLTTKWSAGEYRRYWQWLKQLSAEAETETILAQAGPLAPKQEVFKRPVVLQLPEPPSDLKNVQDDLTLTQTKMNAGMKWKVSEWQDCPLVQIGAEVWGISAALLSLADLDDYMPRVAVLNDREQYQRVSGLREERMISACKAEFESAGWSFQSRVTLKNPPREIDIHASKDLQEVIIQLKSTLRPHSPWEVYKRNTDIIEGIKHTEEMLLRFKLGTLGYVITDGYEGDYLTWAESLRTHIPVATLQELSLITGSPAAAFDILARQAGIQGKPRYKTIPDRTVKLCGWDIRLVDSSAPNK